MFVAEKATGHLIEVLDTQALFDPHSQQVRGSLGAHEQGLIITTSDFSKGAMKEAKQRDKTPVALMNGEQLVTLLMEYGIGVKRATHDLFELDETMMLNHRS